MRHGSITKYRPVPHVVLKDRTWPDKVHTRAPVWCSVDLKGQTGSGCLFYYLCDTVRFGLSGLGQL